MSFLNSVLNNSKKYDDPFKHWELNKPLTEEQINEIVQADIANPAEHNLNSVSYTHLTLPTICSV